MNEPTELENKIAEKVLDAAFIVHRELGPGLLESTYEICLCDILDEYGLKYEKQKILPVSFRNKIIDAGYRIDVLVEGKVIVELKSIEKLMPLHEAQMLTYLKLSNIRLGLLINFNTKLLKYGIKRMVYSQTP